jgi:hypothetical protein
MEKNEQRNLRMFGYYSGRVMESVKSIGMWAKVLSNFQHFISLQQ